jgi:DMSO/TMAO reductase YedYZ molybdopterin-dependent catalytic subunit
MRSSRTNAALAVLVPAALLTGLAGLLGGTVGGRAVFLAHAVAGYAIVALLAPKARIVRGSLRRPTRLPAARRVFLAMAALTLGVLVSGVVWAYTGPVRIAGITLINWHAYAAVLLTVLLVWHVASRRPVRAAAGGLDRAAFLQLAGVTGLGVALTAAERTVEAVAGIDARRRFTGSHELGADGGPFPSVFWLNDHPAPIDPASWRLQVRGRVARPLGLRAADLAQVSAVTREATLDCTGGWFTVQRWTGVPVDAVLALAGADPRASSVRVVGVTGYARRFALDDAGRLLLATHVAGRPLDHAHGAPLRLVVPGRRGFDWVKWIVALEVDDTPAWWQPPLPLT